MIPTVEDAALVRLGLELRERGYAFTTVTPLTQARVNARRENRFAVDLAGVFGWSRPFQADAIPAKITTLLEEAKCLETCADGLRSLVRFSTLGPQVFVHSAYPTTAVDSVFFGPDTVRFVNAVQDHLRGCSKTLRRAADVGCGAGPGGIAIGAAAPDADVWNLDINDAALRLARVNAMLNETPRVRSLHSNLLQGVEGSFDLIVSNPPYLVDPQERAYRHGAGRHGEGLALAILEQAMRRLAPGGTLLLYSGAAIVDGRDYFRAACRDVLDGHLVKHTYREIDPDVFGEELEMPAYCKAERIAAVVLTVVK